MGVSSILTGGEEVEGGDAGKGHHLCLSAFLATLLGAKAAPFHGYWRETKIRHCIRTGTLFDIAIYRCARH